MADRIVIVGAGQAAVQAVETLRQQRFDGSIVVVGDELCLPYQRPPLSKKYLAGALERDRLLLRQQDRYAKLRVEVRLGRRVLAIDRAVQCILLDDGATLPYDALLLATGSRPRRLQISGADLDGVYYLRTVADADALRDALGRSRRIAIIGAGYIGLEVAATCSELGFDVTVLETAERVMKRTAGKGISSFYEAEHARRRVRILCNARVATIVARPGTRHARAVVCDDGSEHPADLVLVAVGAEPIDELAVGAGLERDDGIRVDECCRTSDPHIYAAGDCANQPRLHYGRPARLESVGNAIDQASAAARNMLGGRATCENAPWFWSDQFDLKLITVGLSAGHDMAITRGDPASTRFSICYFRGEELIAIDSVNNPKDHIAARALIGARMRPNPEKLSDAAIPLQDCC